MKTEYYRITLQDHVFVGIVYVHSPDEIEIQVGGAATRKCCTIHIDVSSSLMTISELSYREHCRALDTLRKGEGTTLLLRASVLLAFALFPTVTTLQLQDQSTFPCSSILGDTHHVPLSNHSMLVYGKTWYQRKLPGLHPAEDCSEQVHRFRDVMRHAPLRPFGELWKTLMRHGNRPMRAILEQHKDTIERLYTSSDNYAAFFHKMHRDFKPQEVLCFFNAHFLSALVSFMGLTTLQSTVWEGNLREVVRRLLREHHDQLAINMTEEYNGLEFKIKGRLFPQGRTMNN